MSILDSAFFFFFQKILLPQSKAQQLPLSDYGKSHLSCEQPRSISLCLEATLEPRIKHSVSTSTALNRTSPRQTFSRPAPTCASCIRQGHIHSCSLTSEAACRDPRIESWLFATDPKRKRIPLCLRPSCWSIFFSLLLFLIFPCN